MRNIDLIIPAYNNADGLCRTLQSVLRQKFHTSTHLNIVVYDDGSEEPLSKQLPAHLTEQIKIVQGARNKGRAEARNSGTKAGLSPFLVFLDSDCCYKHNYVIEEHVNLLEQGFDLSIGMVTASGNGFWDDYQKEIFKKRMEALTDDIFLAFTSANFAITRDCFKSVNGFNPSYRYYGFEDRDFIVRVMKEEKKITLSNHIIALHNDTISLQKISVKMFEAARFSAPIFFNNHPGFYKKMPYHYLDLRLYPIGPLRFLAKVLKILNVPLSKLGDYVISKSFIPYYYKKLVMKIVISWCFTSGSTE